MICSSKDKSGNNATRLLVHTMNLAVCFGLDWVCCVCDVVECGEREEERRRGDGLKSELEDRLTNKPTALSSSSTARKPASAMDGGSATVRSFKLDRAQMRARSLRNKLQTGSAPGQPCSVLVTLMGTCAGVQSSKMYTTVVDPASHCVRMWRGVMELRGTAQFSHDESGGSHVGAASWFSSSSFSSLSG